MEPLKGIYLGDRGENFKSVILNLLKKGKISQKYIDILTSKESMKIYDSAFTSELVDEVNNYQVYEQLGDLSGNKFIVYYIYNRFPHLKCAEGVKVVARLRINYGSKNSFCSIAEQYGFWDYISATNETRQRRKKPLLEDVFEAFLGATELILDSHTSVGVGYACVHRILEAIFDDIDISLKYEDLYDGKTRLKELFDMSGDKLGNLVYDDIKEDNLTKSKVYRVKDGSKIFLGEGVASLKPDAQQTASAVALSTLKSQGHFKKPPSVYSKFSKDKETSETTTRDILRFCESEAKINQQCFTRGKSKYQYRYTSPVLAHYCRKRDVQGVKLCLEMGAELDCVDSEDMTPIDLLLIGAKKKTVVKEIILSLVEKVKNKLKIHKNVFERYFKMYNSKTFKKLENKLEII
jgi:dsRNA-specific ribonuclease